MKLHAITISIADDKGHVVLADQAHDEAVSCRVELKFPLGAKPEEGFADREKRITEEARLVLAAALAALSPHLSRGMVHRGL